MWPTTSLVFTCVCLWPSILLLFLSVLHSVCDHPCYYRCLSCTLSVTILVTISVCLALCLWSSVLLLSLTLLHSVTISLLWRPFMFLFLSVTMSLVIVSLCRAPCPRQPVLLLLIFLRDHQPCFYFCLWPSDSLLFLSVLHSVITVVLRILTYSLSVSLHPGSVCRFVEIIMEKAAFYMLFHGDLFALLADSSTVWQS